MYVLVTYKDEENQMKNEGARVVTTLYGYIFDAHVAGGWVWRKIKLIQTFMEVLVTCKIKKKGARVVIIDLPL